jgi:hypothetical protein
MVGGCVSGVEETWLGAGELEVGGADGVESESRSRGCARPWTYLAHAAAHGVSEDLEGLVADRGEEGITVREVSVCGVGYDADLACYLAQDDRVWTP